MANMFRTSKKDKLEFKDIVLSHLKKILEITTQEFRGGYIKETPSGDFILKEYVPDTRKCYIQAVESLSDILLPQFDEKTKKVSKEIKEDIEKLKEDFENKKNKSNEDIREFVIKKLELSRKLFQQFLCGRS